MSVARFFVAADLAVGGEIALPADLAHHAFDVLRLRADAHVTLFNGRGGEYRARLLGRQAAVVEAFDPVERESPLAITLVQALVAQDKLDWIVEKATELGVARIVVAPATRSIVKLAAQRLAARLARWNDRARAACCQCGRNRIPPVTWLPALDEALRTSESAHCFILAPGAPSDLTLPARLDSVTIAIGPEGDFTDAELATAERCGYRRARFGPRILRTETAGVAAIAALQAARGDLRVRDA
ncbi:MAG TPA: 16S rRNA (uracil(1498)-N(3))-methyltransferase [Burkholderiaceae bacterium]|nr:16S rRNA (uracil(1498)-N(3))-methyltransferase [Burkholderiaceae bacterium]